MSRSEREAMKKVWVVELWNDTSDTWEPTVGVRFSREEGRRELSEWREMNPDDRFRLVTYERAWRIAP